jgi:hypothetical protein
MHPHRVQHPRPPRHQHLTLGCSDVPCEQGKGLGQRAPTRTHPWPCSFDISGYAMQDCCGAPDEKIVMSGLRSGSLSVYLILIYPPTKSVLRCSQLQQLGRQQQFSEQYPVRFLKQQERQQYPVRAVQRQQQQQQPGLCPLAARALGPPQAKALLVEEEAAPAAKAVEHGLEVIAEVGSRFVLDLYYAKILKW